MKPPSENYDLIRWLDGEMEEAESSSFEKQMKEDAELCKAAKQFKDISASLRAHLPPQMKVPHSDFFNSQIQIRIAQSEQSEHAGIGSVMALIAGWCRKPWFAVAGAATILLVGFAFFGPDAEDSKSLILSSYTPNSHIQARAFHDDAAEATILMLDGLDEIPPDRKVSGLNVHHSETEAEVAATTLYDDHGAQLLMISKDAVGNPRFWENSPRG